MSSKEEKRRIVASTLNPSLFPGMPLIGFENHLNVFHSQKRGIPEALAYGLTAYLNSGFLDKVFRQFNGHTQVNATDLRSLRYPARKRLEELGCIVKEQKISTQYEIDQIMETLL